jgi:hypothetical protein
MLRVGFITAGRLSWALQPSFQALLLLRGAKPRAVINALNGIR